MWLQTMIIIGKISVSVSVCTHAYRTRCKDPGVIVII